VVDLSPLSVLTRLRHLDLSDTPVSDVSPLLRLPDLRNLDITGTNVVDIEILNGMRSLQVDWQGARPSGSSHLQSRDRNDAHD
jgi:Leucine-rich repeat (LRR) protein